MIASPTKFVISPIDGKNYVNTRKVGGKEIIVNTSVEFANDVQRLGLVHSVPLMYEGDVRPGDVVVTQHNVFRITLNDKGVPEYSYNYIKDDLFGVTEDLIYMVIRDGECQAVDSWTFIKPMNYADKWFGAQEMKHIGSVRYSNKQLRAIGIDDGDLVSFRKNCEYTFEIKGERLYAMNNKRILAKLAEL